MTPVSVIVPMWNDACDIIACLNSIDTTGEVIGEVIVIDNASTDNSASLVAMADIPKIRMIRNSVNVGAAKARHQAILLASYPLITFLDSDDMLGPNSVRDAAADLVSRQLDISIYTMLRFDTSGETHFYIPALTDIISGKEAFNRTIGGWAIHPMGVFKKELYETATRNFDFHGHSDDEVITRYLFLAAEKVGGNQGTYIYREKVREHTVQQILGQAITNLRTLRLAIENDAASNNIRLARNNIVMNILAVVKRGLPIGTDKLLLLNIIRDILRVDVPWIIRDMPYKIAIYLVRPFLLLRHGRQG